MKDRGRFQRKEGLFEGAWFWQDLLIVSSWVLLDKGCHALHCLRDLRACSPARCPLWVSKSEYRRAGKGGREGGSQGALGDWCPAKTVVQPCSLHPNNTFRHPSPPPRTWTSQGSLACSPRTQSLDWGSSLWRDTFACFLCLFLHPPLNWNDEHLGLEPLSCWLQVHGFPGIRDPFEGLSLWGFLEGEYSDHLSSGGRKAP